MAAQSPLDIERSTTNAADAQSEPKTPRPKCTRLVRTLSERNKRRHAANDDWNIQPCGEMTPQAPPSTQRAVARSMNIVYKSGLVIGKLARANRTRSALMLLLPMYGGFATT